MLSLLLLAITAAWVLATVASAASRPIPVLPSPSEALPVAGLGLRWRRLREVQTRNGPRVLHVGEGDATTYSRAYAVARDNLRAVGFSWGTVEQNNGQVVPLCWEDPALPEVLTTTALADADAALASDDVRRRAAEDSRRRAAEMEAMLSGDARRADLDALRHSLATLGWAWSRRKRDLAASLLKEAEEIPGVPKAHVAKLARTLVDEVDYAIETTRQRVSRDPAHDWLERAQVDGMADLAHQATRFITEMDGDMATVRNSAGWGRSHTHAGHVLAAEPVLSAIQASQALSAIFRHRKQLPAALRRELFGDE